ncbi:MAG: hypothetical protein NTW49_03990 [Bacteroidia bacterium]|nr:hypothetical protein [Bacteroidia bacterium]
MNIHKRNSGNRNSYIEECSNHIAKTILVFDSPEEQKEYERRCMASLSPSQLIDNLEKMRKMFLSEYLTIDGDWPPLDKVITIIYSHRLKDKADVEELQKIQKFKI